MGINKTKMIKENIESLLKKYSILTYNKGINELEEYVLTLVNVFDKEEIMKLLSDIYSNLSEEYKEEIVGDIMNRIHGFCSPKNKINWE